MRRKLFAFAAVLVMLACCLVAPAFPQGDGTKLTRSSVQKKSRKSAPKPQKPPPQPPPPTPGASLGERQTASVSIKNFEFRPKSLVVKPGTVVTWTNDAGAHTVTADDNSFSSPTLSAGQTFSHKFARKGTYRYYCSLHGGAGGHDMAGTIVVQP